MAEHGYPDATVVATINTHFVAVQVDTTNDANLPIVERFRQIWTPDLRILAADGYELDAFQGYWSPAEFTPRLLLGRARALARLQREPDAEAAYEEILQRFPRSFVAPEAAYWRAVKRGVVRLP